SVAAATMNARLMRFCDKLALVLSPPTYWMNPMFSRKTLTPGFVLGATVNRHCSAADADFKTDTTLAGIVYVSELYSFSKSFVSEGSAMKVFVRFVHSQYSCTSPNHCRLDCGPGTKTSRFIWPVGLPHSALV